MVRDGVLLLVLERSSDKALQQRMCAVGAALEFGVKLYAHMEITAGQLNSFHQAGRVEAAFRVRVAGAKVRSTVLFSSGLQGSRRNAAGNAGTSEKRCSRSEGMPRR